MNPLRLLIISFWSCLLLAGIGFFNGSAGAGATTNTDYKAIDDYISTRMRSARIPGLAVVIVKGDQIVYSRGYGQADPSGRVVTVQTPFIIGSVSKSITALAVLQLVEAGKVELDAPVQHYLPWFQLADPGDSAQITVKQLLEQTSGIPQPFSPPVDGDEHETLMRSVRSLANLDPVAPPGRSFYYSNGNYNTLGLIVESVSGQSYSEYVKEHIFMPLDMRNSFLSQNEASQHGLAAGYRWWFGFPAPVTLPYASNDLPAGYIISSAEDMAHYLIAQMNGGRYGENSVLSAQGIALTHVVPAPNTYGLGWESTTVHGRTWINHDGGVPNYEASIFFDPQERTGVFMAANVCSALDAFSSPPGSSRLDGSTVRAMTESVLSLTMNQPLPDQGPGKERLYLILDLVLAGLTIALILSLAQIPKRYHELMQRGIASRGDWMQRLILTTVLHFAWPIGLLCLTIISPAWKVLVLYQPDLGAWLDASAVIIFIKGLIEIAIDGQVFMHGLPNPSMGQMRSSPGGDG